MSRTFRRNIWKKKLLRRVTESPEVFASRVQKLAEGTGKDRQAALRSFGRQRRGA
jgi:hypothetical protein